MAKLGLSAPWVIFYREIEAMFEYDPEVRVIFDEDENVVSLFVENADKADALTQLLPEEKEFGNVTLKIKVVPANGLAASNVDLFQKAFEGNGAFAYVKAIEGIFSGMLHYVVFRNKVVQFFTDDLSDIHGFRSTLYQDIAKDIFGEISNVFFCTDIEEPVGLGKPLGEWP